ncbi:MAG: outer membrane protein assembly factor BamA [Rhizobiales bacterium]|nr:outer membrane protein assembly factor BamA [Hyphomicrobiales bacterium]
MSNLVRTWVDGTAQVRLAYWMRNRLSVIGVLVLLALTLAPVLSPATFSRPAYAAAVSGIVINGNQRVEDETILSYMQLGVGDQFDSEAVDESIKVLFQTGLFRDVSIDRSGSQLVITVVENPLISVVNFEGNSEIDDDTLAKEVEVRERMIFTKARVASDNRRILALYQKQGFYNVSVVPKMIRLPENRINLVFEVNEGGKTYVRQINFEGNNSFSDGDLRDVIATKKRNWLFFFLRNTTYDADRLQYDKELIRRYYLKNGFADVQVLDASAQYSGSEEGGFIINFAIEEGPRYTVADVAVNIGDANLEPDKLRKVVKTGVGDSYDASKVDKSVEKLTLEASNQGFVFAKVEPKVDRDPANGKLNITYDITEGPRTYVERIDIVGNDRTLDRVIRRELQLYEGDAYNRTLVERARRRLTALDYFSSVEFKEEPGSAPDKVVLVVEVVEKSTGQISFSIGYSTVETVIGQVSLSERNLFGRGLQAKIDTSLSFKKQSVNLSVTEPYFMGKPIAMGFDVFANASDNKSTSSYQSKQIGGALRTGFRLDEYSSLSLKYLIAGREVSGIDDAVSSPMVISQEGKSWKSAVSATYTYDDLDNPNKPSSGLRAQLETELAGLGGDAQYASVEGHAWYFIPFMDEKVVLKLEANAGHIQSLGNDVPLQDLFFKGADSFRGFARSGLGPKQTGNDGVLDSIGGQTYAIGTVEVNFPLGIPEEWGIEGAVFSDFGTVFGTDAITQASAPLTTCTGATACTVFDSMNLRASVGAGIIWTSPFGPLRLSATYPILKEKTDDTEIFQFSIGTRF